jgi:hypothetical protein
MMRRSRYAALAAIALASVAFAPAGAQSVRVSGSTSLRYIELRPLLRDSVPQDATTGTDLLRQLPDGRVVRCIPEDAFCRDLRPGPTVSTVPVMHDLEASVWGLGEGIRLYSQVRVRTAWGPQQSADLWPRADDNFDLLASYAELERERVRVRLGRQFKVSGLGFYNFDGAAAAFRPVPAVWIEAYGGRSLLRGLNEPRTSGALESIESFAPGNTGIIGGFHARYRPSPRLAMSALYQVDVRTDRGSVYSELAILDGVLRLRGATLDGALEADVATGSINEARLHLRSPPIKRVALFGEVRRYRPYFEQWTIWGAFSPVGFTEGRAGITWADPRGRLIVRGEGSHRTYGDVGEDEGTDEFRTSGWGVGSNVSWSPSMPWRLEASYRVETGFGAARRDAHAGVVRQIGENGSVALQGLLFERLYEFRLQEGKVIGLGAEAAMPINGRTRVVATAATYRHLERGIVSGIDWTQRRGSLRVEWTLGSEPVFRPRTEGVR